MSADVWPFWVYRYCIYINFNLYIKGSHKFYIFRLHHSIYQAIYIYITFIVMLNSSISMCDFLKKQSSVSSSLRSEHFIFTNNNNTNRKWLCFKSSETEFFTLQKNDQEFELSLGKSDILKLFDTIQCRQITVNTKQCYSVNGSGFFYSQPY